MALFIGRLTEEVRIKDLEDEFVKYGRITRCDVKRGYGFVEFEDRRDAEDAIRECNGRDFHGGPMVVEWAKGSRQPRSTGCFKCGKEGHWARDCPEGGGSYDYRDRRTGGRRRYDSRSPRRRGHSRSYSRSPARHRHRRHYQSRSRSRSGDRHRRYHDDQSRSPGGSRSPASSRGRTRHVARSPSPPAEQNHQPHHEAQLTS